MTYLVPPEPLLLPALALIMMVLPFPSKGFNLELPMPTPDNFAATPVPAASLPPPLLPLSLFRKSTPLLLSQLVPNVST